MCDFLSIVIITCNRKNELKKTLDSCIEMAGLKIELIIIDNGSTDGTKEMLGGYKDSDELHIISYFSQENLGVAGGRNKGYELAKSDIIFFMDDDAIINSDGEKLKSAYDYMRQNVDVDALAFEIFDTKQDHLLLDEFNKARLSDEYPEMLSFIGAAHILRKMKEIEILYPPKLMYGAEERYAAFRYYNMGGKIQYFQSVKIIHSPSSKTRQSEEQIHRNVMINQYVIKKLLLPTYISWAASVFYLIRTVKREKNNLELLRYDFHEAKLRYRENRSSVYTLKFSTIRYIARSYGIFVLM